MARWLLAVVFVFAASANSIAATPDQVTAAMQKAKKWLYDHQASGNWEAGPAWGNPKGYAGNDLRGFQYSGQTALCVYALLCAGDNPSEPHVAAGIESLKKASPQGVYALSTRCLVWSSIKLDPATRAIASKDLQTLLRATRSLGPSKGLFFYTAPLDAHDAAYDHSVSQFAVLAIWAMEQKGFEIPGAFWKAADAAWRDHQAPDGGWPYCAHSTDPNFVKITPQMTAAGVASLMITAAQVRGPGTNCDPPPIDANVAKGMEWLGTNFERIFDRNAEAFGGGYQNYSLFGISRIGTASGLANIGKTDWYARATDHLVKTQAPDGSWPAGWLTGPASATSFGLLCMAYGSAPVVVQKLKYAGEVTPGKPADVWNARPRDLFNLARWISTDAERRVNWQVAELADRQGVQLLEAPILLIAGSKALNFSETDVAKLKEFISRGGLIVGNADCLSEEFSKSFQRLGQMMYPQYEFRILPEDHPINARQNYVVKQFRKKIPLKGLTNGVRELMVIPDLDLSKSLNLNDVNSGREAFQMWSNLLQYATDKASLKQKGVSYAVQPDPKVKPARTLRVARLRYAGNWDPEPGGWAQFGAKLLNQDNVALQVEGVDLGASKLAEFKIAHLTGTEATQLTAAHQVELKTFIDNGGTLIVDAAGGQPAFATSVESQLPAVCGGGALKVLPTDHELYGAKVTVAYRNFARLRLPAGRGEPNLQVIEKSGRPAVIYSREDLSAGLVGQNVDGIDGYDPNSATSLMRNILLHVSKP